MVLDCSIGRCRPLQVQETGKIFDINEHGFRLWWPQLLHSTFALRWVCVAKWLMNRIDRSPPNQKQ
jgi:hypothetical protein